MRRIGIPLLILAMGSIVRADAPRGGGLVAEIVRGNNQFALDLYARLRQQPGNLFLSPSSISTALAMTYAGARGETARQMETALHFSIPGDRLHPAFASLGKTLNADGSGRGYHLTVANRLWGQEGYHFLPEFLAVTRESYGAELAQVDFVRQAAQARQAINAWVEERTRGKIKDLIPPGVLDPLTRLVLTNAIYFKGDWSQPFNKASTREAPFHVTGRQAVPIPLMYRQASFRFWAGEGLKALALPYGKGDLTMIVLLPDEIAGLPGLEAKLNDERLGRWLSGLGEQKVQVHLPRFRLDSQFSLADVLRAMGMTLAFDQDRADFSGMSSQDQLSLSAVIHKAYVDVNEEGTEAAAATGVVVGVRAAAPQQPAVFRADHPFVFLIRDDRTGSILFLGRVTNPRG